MKEAQNKIVVFQEKQIPRSKCDNIYHLVTRCFNGGEKTASSLSSIIFPKHHISSEKMRMFRKEDRCGWWDSLSRRLKVGGYKMIDVSHANQGLNFIVDLQAFTFTKL